MRTIAIEDAALQLSTLVQEVEQGEEIILTQANVPIAKIVSISKAPRPRRPDNAPKLMRHPGSAQGLILNIAEDLKSIPEGFEDYLP